MRKVILTSAVKVALLLIMSTIQTKQEAIQIFGGTMRAVGDALGITRQAVYQWPEALPQETSDRLLGAAIRLNLLSPNQGQRADELRQKAKRQNSSAKHIHAITTAYSSSASSESPKRGSENLHGGTTDYTYNLLTKPTAADGEDHGNDRHIPV